jgi:hypothetical protein
MARWKGLDFIVLSDHDTISQETDPAFVSTPDLAVVLGSEWSEFAHGGVVGPRTCPAPIPPADPPSTWSASAQARVDQAHLEGAAFVLNHPCWFMIPWSLPVSDFDAVEVWNTFWTVSDIGLHPSTARTIQDRRDHLGLTQAGIAAWPEFVQAGTRAGSGNDQALYLWETFLEEGRRVAAVGGSDRHRFFLPGYPTTWVLSADRDAASVAAAIRAGRTMVTDGPQGPRVTFEADGDGDGVFESTIGDAVPVLHPVTFRARVEGAKDGLLRIVRRRGVALEQRITADDFNVALAVPLTQPGDWFRVDVFQKVDWSLPGAAQVLPAIAGAGALPTGSQLFYLLNGFGAAVALGANQPVIDFDARYLRVLDVDLSTAPTFDYARAAITSPIYVR